MEGAGQALKYRNGWILKTSFKAAHIGAVDFRVYSENFLGKPRSTLKRRRFRATSARAFMPAREHLVAYKTTEYGATILWLSRAWREPMGYHTGGRRGGLLPDNIREAFHSAVDAFHWWYFFASSQAPEPTAAVWFDDRDDDCEVPISRICGLLWNCTNLMPKEVRDRLQFLEVAYEGPTYRLVGFSYACGARTLRRLIRGRHSHGPVKRVSSDKRPGPEAQPDRGVKPAVAATAGPTEVSEMDIERVINEAIFGSQATEDAPTEQGARERTAADDKTNSALEALARLFGAGPKVPKS